MNRPVPKALSRAAFIVAAILVGYFVLSALSLGIGRGDWILILLVAVLILAFALPFLDKTFGDKLPFLSNWPTPSINARIRRYLGFLFGKNQSPTTAQTGKKFLVNTLIVSSLFLLILAVVIVRALFHNPASDTLLRMLGTAFTGAFAFMAFEFMLFRLNMRYDLKSVLLAIAIYAPIIMFGIIASLVWNEILDDDPFRIRRGFFLLMCCFAVILTTLAPLLHRARKPALPPTFTAHPLYRRAEITASVVSFAAVAIIFLISS